MIPFSSRAQKVGCIFLVVPWGNWGSERQKNLPYDTSWWAEWFDWSSAQSTVKAGTYLPLDSIPFTSRSDWHTSSLPMLILSWPGCLCWNDRSIVGICPPQTFVSSMLFILLVMTTFFLELTSGMHRWLLNLQLRFLISSLIPLFYFWFFSRTLQLGCPLGILM